MAERKTTRKAAEAVPTKALSDKQIVKKLYKNAVCESFKTGFYILDQVDDGHPVHSGLAKSEGDAWKLAARVVL